MRPTDTATLLADITRLFESDLRALAATIAADDLDDEPHVFEASSSGFLSSGHPLTVTVTFDLDPYDPDFLNN